MTDTAKAALWMIGAIASFVSMAVAGREVSFELDTFEIMLFRSMIGVLIVVIIAGATGHLRKVRTQRLGLHFVRNIAHFAGQNLWFYALTVLSLAEVFAFEFTTPVWVIFLSPIFLSDKLTVRRISAAVIGLIGIWIVAQPSAETLNWGVGAAAMCAVGFALTAIFTSMLTRTDSLTTILLYLTVMQTGFGLVAAGYDGDITLPSAASAPWMTLIGCAGLAAHFCLTTALRLAPAGVVMPIDFARLPIIIVIGAVFYGESLQISVAVGAALIIAANWVNLRKSG